LFDRPKPTAGCIANGEEEERKKEAMEMEEIRNANRNFGRKIC
jgi:hypothetical protein